MTQEAFALENLQRWIESGDLDALIRHREAIVGLKNQQLVMGVVGLLMRDELWDDCVLFLESIGDGLEVGDQLKLRLCKNLACLKVHRPEVYKRVMEDPGSTRYRVEGGAGGHASIVDTQNPANPGKHRYLSVDSDPIKGAQICLDKLKGVVESGNAFAVAGIGDGYVFNAIARNPKKLFMHMEQSVYLVEPHADLVRSCMTIHDFTGEDGPIVQGRIVWFVGQSWREDAMRFFEKETMRVPPKEFACLGFESQAICDGFEGLRSDLMGVMDGLGDELEAYYDGVDRQQWLDVFSGKLARKPRVLFFTSIFTTVLQYAARDIAKAFEEMGWEVKICIESHAYERNTSYDSLYWMNEFKPDLIFLLDHLREETPNIFPKKLPVVTWIQDHMHTLLHKSVGQKIGLRDYVLTFAKPMFVNEYDYPEEQCIAFSMMLTNEVALPEEGIVCGKEGGADLVYVSNVSTAPEKLFDVIEEYVLEDLKPLIRLCCERMVGIYEGGGCIEDSQGITEIFDQCCDELGVKFNDGQYRAGLIQRLNNPVNITLYRQQGMAWVAELVEEHGLEFEVYGQGWEDHPQFSKYAKGVVKHGEDLVELTRRSKINLCLEPYACFTHHRLLDGVMAGGFNLVRDHRSGRILQEISDFLADHVVDEGNDLGGETGGGGRGDVIVEKNAEVADRVECTEIGGQSR